MSHILQCGWTALAMLTFVATCPGNKVSAGAPDEPAANGQKGRPEQLWYGVLDAGVREFRFLIEVHRDTQGKLSTELVSLDEGERRFQLTPFLVDDESLSFELKSTQATYAGKLDKDRTTSTGKWKQRGADLELTFHRLQEPPRDTPAERWTGSLHVGKQKLDLQFRVYRELAPDGTVKTLSVRMDSVSQGAGGFKADLTTKEGMWRVAVPAVKGVFEGTWKEEAREIEGTWSQGSGKLPLTLQRADPSEKPAPLKKALRPQTPREPFQYDIENVQFENRRDQVTLAGTLTLPKPSSSDTRFPAVILITGSGPQDRDETIVEHKPFWVLADYLTKRGIAVLRYDDRGTAQSTGKFEEATSEDFSRDAEAAFEFLRGHARIDPRRIGLIGHSEGGIIAPMVASRRDDIAWIVLLAGTAVDGEQVLYSQGRLILIAEGQTAEADLQRQRAVQASLFEALRESEPDAEEAKVVELAMEKLGVKLASDAAAVATLRPAIEVGVKQVSTPWFRYFLTYDPSLALRRVKCPVLALNGDKDVQVDPELHLPAIERALREGGHNRFTLRKLSNLNHLFQTCETGAVSEYATIEETFSPLALETIANWLAERCADAAT